MTSTANAQPDRLSPSLAVLATSLAVLATILLAPPIAAQERYDIDRTLRIGAIDGELALTDPSDVVLRHDGSLVVAHRGEHLVRHFSADGRLLTAFGAEGDGPGEFRSLSALSVRGDTIVVTDSRHARASFFDLRGELLREFTWPAEDRVYRYPLSPVLHGFTAGTVRINTPHVGGGQYAVTRYTEDGAVRDTVVVIEPSGRQVIVGRQTVHSPVPDGDVVGWSPDGTWLVVVERRVPETAGRDTFSLSWLDAEDGRLMRRRSYAYTPMDLPPALFAGLASRSSPAPPEYVSALEDMLRRQRFEPPVSRVVTVDDAVWVAREAMLREEVRWYRFTPEDGATGYVDLPADSRVVAGRGNMVWIVEKDEFDVPYLSRYTLSP